MKKLIILLTLLCFSLPNFAQKGAFIGLRIMPQSAWILNQDDFDSDEYDFGVPFSVAFAVAGGYMFTNTIGVEVQMLYSPQGQDYVDSEKNKFASINNNYFKIPVLFRLRTEGEKVAFLLNAGPQFGFLVNSSIDLYGNGDNFSDSRNFYESFEFSVALGLGTSILLTENLFLDLLLKLDYGLSSIESDLGRAFFYDHGNDGRADSNNALLGFSVGVNYVFPAASE